MKCLDVGLSTLLIYNGLPNADILANQCLMQTYLGTFGGQSLFVTSQEWFEQSNLSWAFPDGRWEDVPDQTTEIAVVYQNAVETELIKAEDTRFPWNWFDERLDAVMQRWDWAYYAPPVPQEEVLRCNPSVARPLEVEALCNNRVPDEDFEDGDGTWEDAYSQDQLILEGADEEVESIDEPFVYEPAIMALHRSPKVTVLAFRNLSSTTIKLDTLLDPSYKIGLVPYPPSAVVPVPSDDISRVRSLLSSLKFEESVSKLVNIISVTSMRKDITWLTGEAKDSPIESRHSFHPDTRVAASWIKDQIEGTGAECELRPFLQGFAPNVICRYAATENTTSLVLLSAHYDSRGSFGSTRAPGGDDDGSGTTAILAIARSIALSGVTFKSNVELCLFAGEEQGLLGSRAYARELRAADANITVMIQADMLAYHKPGEPPQLGLPDLIGTPEVAQLVANISALYSPELEVGVTPACCSDHQSFHEQGFASTQVFERAGPIADPMYHNSGDLSERTGYDLQQVRSIAKVQFATLLHAAGFSLPN